GNPQNTAQPNYNKCSTLKQKSDNQSSTQNKSISIQTHHGRALTIWGGVGGSTVASVSIGSHRISPTKSLPSIIVPAATDCQTTLPVPVKSARKPFIVNCRYASRIGSPFRFGMLSVTSATVACAGSGRTSFTPNVLGIKVCSSSCFLRVLEIA